MGFHGMPQGKLPMEAVNIATAYPFTFKHPASLQF